MYFTRARHSHLLSVLTSLQPETFKFQHRTTTHNPNNRKPSFSLERNRKILQHVSILCDFFIDKMTPLLILFILLRIGYNLLMDLNQFFMNKLAVVTSSKANYCHEVERSLQAAHQKSYRTSPKKSKTLSGIYL